MARGTKAKSVKSKLKSASAAAKSKAAPASKKVELRLVKNPAPAIKAKANSGEKRVTTSDKNSKVSQKLIETIERRKKEKQGGAFAKPPGRRGRRPKHPVDYVPTHGENEGEEGYVLESEYEGLEYDTGIRFKDGMDDKGFSMERFEEFDEELNFDW